MRSASLTKPPADAGSARQSAATTSELHKLYHDVGQLIALESARKAPRILIDGDIEIAWPQDVKDQIEARIITKMAEIARSIRDLQNGE